MEVLVSGRGHEFGDLFDRCTQRAKEVSDGHFTLCRFTTNWRAGFFTPSEMMEFLHLAEGATPEQAMQLALETTPLHPTKAQTDRNFRRMENEVDNLLQSQSITEAF